jgi:hypothetical protein
MSRIVRVIARHALEIDVDILIDDCEIGENLDVDTDTLTDEEAADHVAGFFDTDCCIPRWARDGVRVIDNK